MIGYGYRGIVTPGGETLPPSDVVARVKAWDPALKIVLVHGQPPYWAVVRDLPDQHPNKRSEFPYDLLCALPMDCSVDQMGSYVENHLRRALGPKEVREATDAILKDREQAERSARVGILEDVRTELVEEAERSTKRDFDLMAGVEAAHALITVPG